MNFLIGWLIGERVGQAAGSLDEEAGNALWGIFWWWVIGALAYYGFESNFGQSRAISGECAVLLMVLLFCFFRPIGSSFKMMMLEAICFIAGLAMLCTVGFVLVRVGWAVISGELKNNGVSSLPHTALTNAGLYALCAFLVISFVRFMIGLDARRFMPQPAPLAPAPERPAASTARANQRSGGRDEARNDRQEKSERKREEASKPAPPPEPPKKDWWVILEVDRNCSRKEAEAAARSLLKKYHPDTVIGERPRLRESAESETRSILEALAKAKAEKPL